MKIDEVQVGEIYALSSGGYDNPLRSRDGRPAVVKVVAIERVAETSTGWTSRKTRNVRRVVVEFAQPFVQRAFYTNQVEGEFDVGDRYPKPLDAKHILQIWAEYQQARAEEIERFRPGKERVQRLTEVLGPYFTETQIRPSRSDHERGDMVIRIDYGQVDEMLDRLKKAAAHAG